MSRTGLLEKLINMEGSVDFLTDELNKFGWDSDEELVILTRKHIFNALKTYLEGRKNETEIENWSNAIEVREDIGREKSFEDLINKILHELSNPYLTEPLTKEKAKILCSELI